MEIKTKYQYTYFIYPYVVNENKFDKYLSKLIHNKNCKLKIFEKEKDSDLYEYFLPKVRDYMFWSFNFNKSKMDKLKEFDNQMKVTLIKKYPCTIFEYQIDKYIQGKTDKKEGIFFNVRNIEIICFNTGLCFLVIKTTLDEGATLSDLCNFNYKFRDINSSINKLKDFENIKIQTDAFQDVKGISAIIKEIAGNNLKSKELNLDTERFITYTYACVGQEDYNENSNEELLENEFYKLANVEYADYVVDYNKESEVYKIEKSKYIKYGATSAGMALLASDINTDNYTKIPNKYENEYLYHFIYELYKKIYLKKIANDFKMNNKFEVTKEKFIKFTQSVWIDDITSDEFGNMLSQQWDEAFRINKTFAIVKQKYDIMYKNVNVSKIERSNKIIVIVLVVLAFINIINVIAIMQK